MFENMKNLTQQRIIELLEEVAKAEMLMARAEEIGINPADGETFARFCTIQTTVAITKAKLTALQGEK